MHLGDEHRLRDGQVAGVRSSAGSVMYRLISQIPERPAGVAEGLPFGRIHKRVAGLDDVDLGVRRLSSPDGGWCGEVVSPSPVPPRPALPGEDPFSSRMS